MHAITREGELRIAFAVLSQSLIHFGVKVQDRPTVLPGLLH